jgi:hypothetical protein
MRSKANIHNGMQPPSLDALNPEDYTSHHRKGEAFTIRIRIDNRPVDQNISPPSRGYNRSRVPLSGA